MLADHHVDIVEDNIDKDDPHVILPEIVPTYAEYRERSETTLSCLLPGMDAIQEENG